MKRNTLLFACFLFLNHAAWAGPVEEPFFRANQLYANGKVEEAKTLYEELAESGVSSGPLHYNLGNAYFKLGQIGKAILNYERARRITPQDEDLLANLSYVKTLVEQAQPAESGRLYEHAFFAIRDSLSATGWVLCLAVFFNSLFLLWLMAIFFQRTRKHAVFWSWVFSALTLGTLLFGSSKLSAQESMKEGIIVQSIADVRYSPSKGGAVAFQLKEGLRAQVLRCDEGWCSIRLTRDKSGWVERGAIEEI